MEMLPHHALWSSPIPCPPMPSGLYGKTVRPIGFPERTNVSCSTQLISGSYLFLWVGSQFSCQWQKIMLHKFFTLFIVESISSWSLVWLQIIPQAPLVLCTAPPPPTPRISCHWFIQTNSNVLPDFSLLSWGWTFISDLGNSAEIGESAETFFRRPNAHNSCVSLTQY